MKVDYRLQDGALVFGRHRFALHDPVIDVGVWNKENGFILIQLSLVHRPDMGIGEGSQKEIKFLCPAMPGAEA